MEKRIYTLTDINEDLIRCVDRYLKKVTIIDDWECTLMLAQLGLKYQDYDLKQQMKEFEEQLRSQTKE